MNSITLQGQILRTPEQRYTTDEQIPIASTLLEFQQIGAGGEPVPATVSLKGWGTKASEQLMKVSEGHRVVVTGSLRVNSVDMEDYKEKRAEIWISNLIIVESTATHPTN